MNTKLCVQVLSESTACGIDFCRVIGIEGFENSEATVEFFRVNDEVFDLLNSRPLGEGKRAPCSDFNKIRWSSIIASAIEYYLSLAIARNHELIPIYKTKNGTFVKGIISCLRSLQLIMGEVEKGKLYLK